MPLLKVGMCPALTEEIYVTLRDGGVRDVVDLASANLEDIARISDSSYKDLIAVKRVVLAQFSSFPVNGIDLYEDVLSSTAILSTGSGRLDQLLDGGLYTGEVTEVAGNVAAGKTQKLESACSHLQRRTAFDAFELLEKVEDLKQQLSKQGPGFYGGVRLLVIDSIASVISPLLGGLHTDGQVYMMHLAKALSALAFECSIAVLVTNNVVYNEQGESRPSLGRAWRHVPHVRIEMTKQPDVHQNAEASRTICMLKSCRQVGNSSFVGQKLSSYRNFSAGQRFMVYMDKTLFEYPL